MAGFSSSKYRVFKGGRYEIQIAYIGYRNDGPFRVFDPERAYANTPARIRSFRHQPSPPVVAASWMGVLCSAEISSFMSTLRRLPIWMDWIATA